jgi:hypothetical protein
VIADPGQPGRPHPASTGSEGPAEGILRKAAACRRVRDIASALAAEFNPTQLENLAAGTASLLLPKALKTTGAILRLLDAEDVEDAVILARSLAGICIDLAYIAGGGDSGETDDRARDWRASGLWAERTFAQRVGLDVPNADRYDWEDVRARKQRWQGPGAIEHRARVGKVYEVYNWAYRHASSFEHSDSWSALVFAEGGEKYRPVLAQGALVTAAAALWGVVQAWAKLCRVDIDAVNQEVEGIFEAASSTEPRAGSPPH